jgi:hypothetical protein
MTEAAVLITGTNPVVPAHVLKWLVSKKHGYGVIQSDAEVRGGELKHFHTVYDLVDTTAALLAHVHPSH